MCQPLEFPRDQYANQRSNGDANADTQSQSVQGESNPYTDCHADTDPETNSLLTIHTFHVYLLLFVSRPLHTREPKKLILRTWYWAAYTFYE
jgi:hypothetical protein